MPDLTLCRRSAASPPRFTARPVGRSGMLLAIAAALPIAGMAATLVFPPRPLLLWNASASSPVGLYRIGAPDRVSVGSMVIAWAPEPARKLGAMRHYLPYNVPLVKRVAAAAGDEVCAVGGAVFVNGRPVALRSERDPSGRRMPWWSGCRRLARGELFLLNPSVPQAFDGRYFGVTPASHVVGTGRLLWQP